MPNQSVVEELLEKGAQAAWDSDSPMALWEQVPPKLQAGYRSQVSAAFDAVFPGWREGHSGDGARFCWCSRSCDRCVTHDR